MHIKLPVIFLMFWPAVKFLSSFCSSVSLLHPRPSSPGLLIPIENRTLARVTNSIPTDRTINTTASGATDLLMLSLVRVWTSTTGSARTVPEKVCLLSLCVYFGLFACETIYESLLWVVSQWHFFLQIRF